MRHDRLNARRCSIQNPQPHIKFLHSRKAERKGDEFDRLLLPLRLGPLLYENLSVILKKYEHWAHVMFPKLKFEDVVNRCESLGDRRIVYMTKSRLDMPVSDEDFATRKRKGDEIIVTENNEHDSKELRGETDSDENYYDPLESTKEVTGDGSSFEVNSSLRAQSPRVNSKSQEIDNDMMEAISESVNYIMEEEQRRREEAELAMANEIMDDFDMY
ncbi:replication Fork Protection Component Swi3 [Necator americanus]|uniref:TIMELESS-interacting protein n=1 Tax=Necator americanus TaxID=51031 RepID=W2TL63_NECAM|nr:replication Fork Protection Component Swi3 [Necator americanus]ETN81886.1 replication Fork Protection Component Swi3 [Necator americanus]